MRVSQTAARLLEEPPTPAVPASTEISLREISQYATIDKIPRPRPGYFIVTDRPTEALARLLADLPIGTRTRISIARNQGEWEGWETDQHRSARNVTELGGFHAIGPIDVGEIARWDAEP